MFISDIRLSDTEKEIIISDCKKEGETIAYIKVWGENGDLAYQPHYKRSINRIRRICGYFSKVENFNDAKRAELTDRVTHA